VIFAVAVDVCVDGLEAISGLGVVVSVLGTAAPLAVAVLVESAVFSLVSVEVVYVYALLAFANDLEIYLATFFSSSSPI